ncbi:hypothetical protein FSST1_000153 [Fusarium sambucinum]
MTEASKPQTTSELESYLCQLHRLRLSGSGWIGSCSGGPAYDHRRDNMSTCGRFASVTKLHDFLMVRRRSLTEGTEVYHDDDHDLEPETIEAVIDDFSITFAHADISWENIFLDPLTGSVTGIVAWEIAGFWPEWWECRKALFGSRSRQWWIETVKQIMKGHPLETEADMDIEMF